MSAGARIPIAPLLCIRSIAVTLLVSSLMYCEPASAVQVHLDGRTFTVPDGFTVERVAGSPLVDRPVVADFDDLGRLYVADSSGSGDLLEKQLVNKPHSILRLGPADADGHFTQRTLYADRMMFPEGVLCYAGSVYMSGVPSIWKLTDTKGDGVADTRIEWFQGKTMTHCGNDLHGPYLGPDGWIYWCKGAFAEQTYERPGHKPFVTRASHIFRCRPDGSGIEPVMTGGMDNPVHVVFTPGGERIFTTTFLVNPEGGHRDGIIHAIYGGVYGKVHDDVLEGHQRTSPQLMPVLVHLGPAACCGLARYESDSFGPEYRDNLFAACFNLHKVTRHILKPQGATFSTIDQDFLVCDNLDFHPTDIVEDADGSLLVLDTGGWYKLCCPTSQLGKPDVLGAIYRVKRIGAPVIEDPRGLKLAWAKMKAPSIAKLLDDPRPAVRKRAIAALAAMPGDALEALDQFLGRTLSAQGRLNAIWAATRIDDPKAREIVRNALQDPDETVRQAAAHSASVWRDRDSLSLLLDMLANGTPPNRRIAAEAIGRIGNSRAIKPLLAAIATPTDRALEHSLTFALIEINDAKVTAEGLKSSDPRVQRATLMALDQMETSTLEPATVAAELNAKDPDLREAAAWIAARHKDWGGALVAVLRDQLGNPALGTTDLAQLQQQLAALAGSPAIADLLTDRLQDPSATDPQRRITLGAMKDSRIKQVPASWKEALFHQLTTGDAPVVADCVASISQLSFAKDDIAAVDAELRTTGERTDLPASTRLAALSAIHGKLAKLSRPLFDFIASQLTTNPSPSDRIAAAQILGHATLDTDEQLATTELVRTAGPLEIDPLLRAFDRAKDSAVGMKLVAALKQARSLRSLHADTLKLRLKNFGPEVQQEAEPLFAQLSPDAGKQKTRLDQLLATLPPGDVRRGQVLFNGTKASCFACHAIGYVGGHVGPDLTRIGQIRAERDLLESIVFPSASFVQSFEPVMVETTDGERQYGIVRTNDADEVMLVTGPNLEVHIPKSKLKRMLPGAVSLMPDGFDQVLAPQELADLVAFLRACR